MHGRPIKLFNNGQMGRDFTYIDDVVEAVARLVVRPPEANPAWTAGAPDPATSQAPWRVYNIGNSKSVEVEQVVRLIEQILGKSAIRELLPMQPGNVLETYADVSALCEAVGSSPRSWLGRPQAGVAILQQLSQQNGFAQEMISALEERAIWSRYGL
jgi:UDP-glucuronate 4-epimerase